MASVDKDFADRLIKGDGYVDGNSDNSMGDNPRCVKIVAYDNAWGGVAYGLTFEADRDPMKYERATEFVRNPRRYWVHGVKTEAA